MAYTQDKTGAITISGWEKGISDNPYEGITDMRGVNIVSVPGEASVNFSTTLNTNTNVTGSVISTDSVAKTISISGAGIQTGQAVTFTGLDAVGIITGTVYWAIGTSNPYTLYTNYGVTAVLNITGNGTGTYTSVPMGTPKYFTHLVTPYVDTYFMVDSTGYVWSNFLAVGGLTFWRYTGNAITGTNGTAHGNGIVAYVPSDTGTTGLGYIFVFRDFQIDFATINSNAALTWTYGWNPATGITGQNNYLKSANTGTQIYSHEAIVAPDNKVYYCDGNWIGRFYQTAISTGFNPASGNTTTHTADNTKVLPATDTAQCLAPLGNTLLIGGINNIIYPWDTFSQLPSFPIFVAEYNIQKMITVNTNTFIFAGNRGRIYYTNGAQAQLFKKVPDHISGTVEPYFTWGGIASNKNQLYFGVKGLTNAGASLSGYGGLWAIDLDTKAIRLMNLLSYNTELGYATAIIPNFSTNPAGAGIYIGWDSGVSAYGIDTTSSTPQTSYTAYIETDIIPVGTFLDKKTFSNLEFKLSTPMVAGEGIRISQRSNINGAWTQVGETTTTVLSDVYPVNFESTQWVQFKIEMKSTASNPSYVRLRNLLLR
jgi:hypothetical protein